MINIRHKHRLNDTIRYFLDTEWLSDSVKSEIKARIENIWKSENAELEKLNKTVQLVEQVQEKIRRLMVEFIQIGGQLTKDEYLHMVKGDRDNYGRAYREYRLHKHGDTDRIIEYYSFVGDTSKAFDLAVDTMLEDIDQEAGQLELASFPNSYDLPIVQTFDNLSGLDEIASQLL